MFPKDWIGNMPKCSGRKDFLNFPLQDFQKKTQTLDMTKKTQTRRSFPQILWEKERVRLYDKEHCNKINGIDYQN